MRQTQSEEINMPRTSASTNRARKAAISVRSDADGPSWTRCQGCPTPTATQAHCPVAGCHRTFSTVSNFDRVRKDGHCIDPATLGMAPNAAGVWRVPMTEEERERMEWAR